MSVENSYPWAGGLHAADRLTPGSDVKLQSKGDSGVKESHGLGSKTFVLFVKLPNWKQHNEVFEVCTLRNLWNYVEVFKVKQLLELAVGIPAHTADLYSFDDKIFSDSVELVLGTNIASGSTVSLRMRAAWNDLAKAIWTNSSLSSPLAMAQHLLEDREKEIVSVGLFIASSRGNVSACTVLLDQEANPNYSTVFGNSSIHCAAYKGHLDVLHLLVARGANMRLKNVRNKSAMDIAISQGFVDCAKWLWLNQWTINITRSSTEKQVPLLTPGSMKKQSERIAFKKNPPGSAKLSTQDQKPNPRLRSGSSEKRYQSTNGKKLSRSIMTSYRLPRSSVYKSSIPVERTQRISFPSIRHTPTEIGERPTVVPKHSSGVKTPTLSPDIAASLKREQTIPSKYDCRYPTCGDVAVTGKLNKLFRPTTAHSYASEYKDDRKMEEKNFPGKDVASSTCIATNDDKMTYANLHASSSNSVDFSSFNEKSKKTDQFVKLSPRNTDGRENMTCEATTRSKDVLHDKPVSTNKLNHVYVTETIKIKSKLVESMPTGKSDCYRYLDDEKQLQKNAQGRKPVTHAARTKDTEGNLNIRERNKPTLTNQPPKGITKEESSEDVKLREKQKREKIDKAYNEWLAVKQRERISQKKTELLNSVDVKRKHNSADTLFTSASGKTWGITFEEWLERKKNSNDPRPSTSQNESTVIKNRPINGGKTFEEWLREKSTRQHPQEIQRDEQKERQLKELRQRNFEKWIAQKTEHTKEEKRRTEELKQKRMLEMRQGYEEWKTQPRVITFDEWRKRKDNEKKLSELSNAQFDVVQALSEWLVRDREQLAEQAFRRWTLRKESQHLQAAQQEWNMARVRRKKVEQKLREKLAMLRAKAKLRSGGKVQSGDEEEFDLSSELETEAGSLPEETIVIPQSECKSSEDEVSSNEDDTRSSSSKVFKKAECSFAEANTSKVEEQQIQSVAKPVKVRRKASRRKRRRRSKKVKCVSMPDLSLS